MKIRLLILTCAALLIGARAQANSITFSDTFDPADVFMDNSGGSCTGTNGTIDTVTGFVSGKCLTLSYTHALTGYSNPPMTLTSGTLTLYFHDDADSAAEKIIISLDATIFSPSGGLTITSGSTAGTPFAIGYNVIAQITSDGQLSVVLTRQAGDFYFDYSVLDAVADDGQTTPLAPAPVPEPESLLLFGTGALGVAYLFRRRFARS